MIQTVFPVDGTSLDKAAKVGPPVRKFGAPEHTQYHKHIPTKHPQDRSLKETSAYLKAVIREVRYSQYVTIVSKSQDEERRILLLILA